MQSGQFCENLKYVMKDISHQNDERYLIVSTLQMKYNTIDDDVSDTNTDDIDMEQDDDDDSDLTEKNFGQFSWTLKISVMDGDGNVFNHL